MTRLGFFLFNLVLVVFIYGLVYLNGAKTVAMSYMLRNFSIPYIVLILLMTFFTTVRWFMHHDPDVGREIGTWANALWFVPAITVLALYLIGGIPGNFWQGLHSLMTLR